MSLLKVENLGKSFGGVKAVDSVSLDIAQLPDVLAAAVEAE